jgi:hypothetical protein
LLPLDRGLRDGKKRLKIGLTGVSTQRVGQNLNRIEEFVLVGQGLYRETLIVNKTPSYGNTTLLFLLSSFDTPDSNNPHYL